MTKKIGDVVFGLLFLVLGIILIGNVFNFWDIKLFFKGWWTLFIIIPSITGLVQKGTRMSSCLGIIIGILLLLAARGNMDWSTIGKIFIPCIFILVGISIIFKRNFKQNKKIENGETPNYMAVFASNEDTIVDAEFPGANIISVFGGVDLRLNKAKISKDIVINCTTIFGGADIFLPDNVKVKTSGVPLFGGIENSRAVSVPEDSPTVYINYVCIFGGAEIK